MNQFVFRCISVHVGTSDGRFRPRQVLVALARGFEHHRQVGGRCPVPEVSVPERYTKENLLEQLNEIEVFTTCLSWGGQSCCCGFLNAGCVFSYFHCYSIRYVISGIGQHRTSIQYIPGFSKNLPTTQSFRSPCFVGRFGCLMLFVFIR